MADAEHFDVHSPRQTPHGVVRLDIDSDGRVTAVHAVLASRRLTAVRF